jgi:hypothetical protein
MCRGPFSGSNLYFLHHRVWYNDPDPIYVRESVPLSHARALTSWVALTGQLNASSIQFDELPKERLALLQKSIPAHTLKPRPVDLFEERIARAWLLTDDRAPVRRDVIGLFNWEENEAASLAYPLARLGLPEKGYLGFDYWGDTFVGPFYDVLESTLEPASCRILAVKPVRDFPQLLGTSRHITQGVMDVVQEDWEASTQTLQGRSRVVGGDVYQLRIAAMGKDRVMPVVRVSVSSTDQKAGVSIRLVSQDAWKVRVEIKSGTSREVSWRIHF